MLLHAFPREPVSEVEVHPQAESPPALAAAPGGSEPTGARAASAASESEGPWKTQARGAASPPAPAEAASILTGELIDAEGLGREGIELFLLGPRSTSSRNRSSARGSFRFEGLERGRHRLRVGSRDSPWIPEITVDLEDGLVDLGAIALPPLGSIDILVVDESGAPVPGARVFVPGSYELESDAHGRCSVGSLPAGLHRWFGSLADIGRGNTVLELAAGESASIRIVLRSHAGR